MDRVAVGMKGNFCLPTQVSVFFGGLSIKKDEDVLKKNCPHVVVGTPGRILALVRNRSLSLKHVKHFVLDECDKMLEQLGACPPWVQGRRRPAQPQPHPPPSSQPPGRRSPQSGVMWAPSTRAFCE